MKTLKFTAIVLGLFSLLAGTTTLVRAQDYQDSYQDDGYSTGNVSLQTFYDELSPYGTWIQDPQYGYVWRPDVDQNEFRPYYTNGRWAMTEYGNTWVSNYDWGWAPFHYGRWVINSYRQWIWLPDTNWGPAWVDWRSGDGYYGWAPMAPSISINLSFGRRYSVPEFCWNFIPQASIYVNIFPRYDYGRNNVYIRNTTIINNTYVYNRRSYYGGPRMEDIRRATNRDVRVYRFDQSNRPGASRIDSRAVSIYRPRPERNAVDNRNAAPRKFEQGNAGFARNGRGNDNATRGGNNNTDNRFGNRNDNRTGQADGRNNGTVDRGNNNNQPNTRGGVYNRDANGRGDRIGQNNGQANVDRNQDQQRAQQAQQQRAERGGQQDRMGQDQQRAQRDVQTQQQRGQQADQQRVAQMEQQRAQRDAQIQQQRGQQADQQRAQQVQQRSAQMEQQRAQRDAQAQQQRSQQADQQRAQQAQQRSAQMEQQRAQRDAQAQQQRSQQVEQQRAQQAQQREAQVQQQRAQQQQQQQQRTEQRRVEAPQQQQNRGGERSGSEGRPSRGGRG